MPELPEVETMKRALELRLTGRRFAQTIQRRPDLRWPLPAQLPQRLAGRRVEAFGRRAKYIQLFLDDGQVVLLHMGMSGRLIFDGNPQGAHEHLTFSFDDGTVLRFVDPRRFGALDLTTVEDLPRHRLLAGLGMEPLGNAFSGLELADAFRNRIVAVKLALMDQKLVVGVGNIYASEALFRTRLNPATPAGAVPAAVLDLLAENVRAVLGEAIEAGGSSLRDYVQADGELGSFQNLFKVYDRAGKPCLVCETPIVRSVQGNRATFFCTRCQSIDHAS
ncbi:MAG TPA: bifunctional DNA-formamidopyrimidine glycosylase/DNA-(apurinic or apyrimidinic site) lyase [Geminicoccus sp.]|uniref:bifunctional DNA-formamidopyrimidine glycosylase/DNA-(apurinic or apyrimidinic site) lyase n=1 Tax=Geminicoccus sp. TaxID=2024832 RepID=UPI002E316479|nr:bifunctional DNA-formamidopyrimidine glycosylase/DNA-(apurinic or apyrimidinic site) lyase [Geminicoccus sp.]HEX2525123.1 bifunctional DNA-formamidopyrimidine glycosylase/DNA-(apurinic or apyrimidinic site) lyase [Geminicoccus sp.]